MGISDELKTTFGADFFTRKREPAGYHNWCTICMCGHIDRFHAELIGGTYQVPVPEPRSVGGQMVTVQIQVDGCLGAMPTKGFTAETVTMDREALTHTTVRHATCPCTEFRPVANVDKPNRFFNQRLPVDRDDRERHPFMVGLRAFSTHLSRRRAALSNPAWAEAELERRFSWIEDKRVCAIGRCRETKDVWPVLIDGELSEMRCSAHR
jgi:hypothetical protein